MMEWYRDEISEKELKSLSKYKYSAIDRSPIANYILQPYWTWAAELFPIWMAPNLITFLGFLFVMGNFLLLLVYSPDLQTPGPNWIYISFAIGMWLYSTFDNVDGKQARRTGTSSPLGELFDHAVDALNCTTGGLLQAAGVVLGPTHATVAIIGIASTAFYFATWETYYTGTLFLGVVNGPTEGLLVTIGTLIISGIYGPQVWNQRALDVIPPSVIQPILSRAPILIQKHFEHLIISHLAIYTMLVLLFTFQIPDSVSRVFSVCRQKGGSFKDATLNLISYLVMLGSVAAWTMAPGSRVVIDHIVELCLAWGIAVARINAWIILNHVTHSKYPKYKFFIAPFAVGAALWWIPHYFEIAPVFTTQLESYYIYTILIVLTVEYLLWAFKVVEQLCAHLGIKCFVIPVPEIEEEVRVKPRSPSRSTSDGKTRSRNSKLEKSFTEGFKSRTPAEAQTTPKKSVVSAVADRESEGVALRRSPRNKNK